MNEFKQTNKQTNKQTKHALNEFKAKHAVHVLFSNIASIPNVKSWALRACMSKESLNQAVKTTYDKVPKTILREVRFEVIVFVILKKGLEAASRDVAQISGVGKTSDALYKFLKRHYGVTFRDVKEKILTGELQIPFFWLDEEVIKIK